MSKVKVIVGTLFNGLLEGNPVIIVEDGTSRPAVEISHREVLCEQNTSFRGDLLDSFRVFSTPYGLVQRHYYARGGGLERTGVTFKIVASGEIAEKAIKAQQLAAAAQAAAEELKRFSFLGGAS